MKIHQLREKTEIRFKARIATLRAAKRASERIHLIAVVASFAALVLSVCLLSNSAVADRTVHIQDLTAVSESGVSPEELVKLMSPDVPARLGKIAGTSPNIYTGSSSPSVYTRGSSPSVYTSSSSPSIYTGSSSPSVYTRGSAPNVYTRGFSANGDPNSEFPMPKLNF